MATARDPICGMMVETRGAAGTTVYEGITYYFCSEDCFDQFEREPARFAAGGRQSEVASSGTETDDAPVEQHEPPWTTRGKFTAPKFGSAGSGGAEYELLPEAHKGEKRGRRKKK
jgi:Cu+-exporting ATPase